ncbi:unnamed protein product, partial [Prorocentrum cordatum]
ASALVVKDRVSPDAVVLNLQAAEPKYSRLGAAPEGPAALSSGRPGASAPSPRSDGGRRGSVQSGPAIWESLLEAKLVGKTTRRFYQSFSFSWPGAIWGIATSAVYAYMVYAPDPAMSGVFGKTAVAFFANVLLFVTLCGNFAVYGSKWFLEGQALARAVEQCGRTLGSDPKAGSTFNANKWDFDTPLLKCRFALKLLAHLAAA